MSIDNRFETNSIIEKETNSIVSKLFSLSLFYTIGGASLIPFKEELKPYLNNNIYNNFNHLDVAVTLSLIAMTMTYFIISIHDNYKKIDNLR